MKPMLWFWGAFLLFFALPFPCIIYFGEQSGSPAPASTAWALTLLGASLALWLGLIYQWLDKLLLGPPRALLRVKDISTGGLPRRARIERALQTGTHVRGFAQWQLQLAFDNLSDTPITEQLQVVDTQPALNRFVEGRSLDIRLSPQPGPFPNMVLEGAKSELDTGSLVRRALGLLLLIALICAAYAMVWQRQNAGLGWTFLSLGHPLLVCPFVLWLYVLAGQLFLRRIGGDARGEVLKYRGIGVEAKVLGVRQTGTYLNEQPQVEFELEYPDTRGTVHRTKVRHFIAQIDLAHIPRERVQVLYDPENPATVRMEVA